MAKKQTKKQEPDGVFFLKLAMYMLLSSFWVRIVFDQGSSQLPIPLGLALSLLFASHEHFQIDRKIEFGIIVVGCFIGYWLQTGLLISY